MITGKNGIELIKKYEGLELKAYKCPAGKWTIGYGHTLNVKSTDVISRDDAEYFLKQDLKMSEDEINKQGLQLNQNQFDALVSFTFNLGVGNFRKSTLLKKLKVNVNDLSIAGEFKKWVNANGKKLAGLVRRRAEEAELYFKV